MTVSESIVQWLYTFGNIELDERVETDQLNSEAESMGLFKAPGDVYNSFVDGGRDVQSFFLFRIRQSSQDDTMRISSHSWIEDLERWVFEQNIKRNLPPLDGNRKCYGIEISTGGYMLNTDAEESVYQIGITIKYSEVT